MNEQLGKIYISGPMKGKIDHNYPAFHAEAARLRAKGYFVVNPAEINPQGCGRSYKECLGHDLFELAFCDTIAMMVGWEPSNGATIERNVAKALGLNVVDLCEL